MEISAGTHQSAWGSASPCLVGDVPRHRRVGPLAAERRAEVGDLDVGAVAHEAQQVGAGGGPRQPDVALTESLQLPHQRVARLLEVALQHGLGVPRDRSPSSILPCAPPPPPAVLPPTTVVGVSPRVHSIHLAPGRRLPTKAVQQVEAEAGVGLGGDSYHGSRAPSRDRAGARRPRGRGRGAGPTGRPGPDPPQPHPRRRPDPDPPGERLQIGDVELEVVRIAAPCRLLDDWLGPGAMQALKSPRGGTVFRLLTSGTITVGDEATWA